MSGDPQLGPESPEKREAIAAASAESRVRIEVVERSLERLTGAVAPLSEGIARLIAVTEAAKLMREEERAARAVEQATRALERSQDKDVQDKALAALAAGQEKALKDLRQAQEAALAKTEEVFTTAVERIAGDQKWLRDRLFFGFGAVGLMAGVGAAISQVIGT